MFCDECGREIPDGSLFCENCGANLGEGAQVPPAETQPLPAAPPAYAPPPSPEPAATPPPPTPPGGEWATAPQPPPPPPGGEWGSIPQAAAPTSGKSKVVPALVAVCALLLVGVVVLVLMLTVFKGGKEETGKDGKAPGPAATAEAYIKALEDRDIEALLDLIDPRFLEDLKEEYGKEYKDLVEGYFIEPLPEDLSFSGLEFSEEIKGGRAEVALVKGKATYRDENGKKVTEDLAETMEDTLELVRRDDKWYLDMDGFEEWEDYLDSYESGGDTDGGDKNGGDTGGLEEFMDMQLGIKFGYPEGWAPKEYSEGLVEVVPTGAEERAKVTFYTEDLTGVEYSLEDWIDSETEELAAQGWPYKVTRTTLGGSPAAQITFSYLGEQSYGYKVMDTFTISMQTAYVVSYIAQEEYFDAYLSAVKKMIGSFKIIVVN